MVPSKKLFSLEEEIDDHNRGASSEEFFDEEDEHMRDLTGQFFNFDLQAMDDFLDHLWDVLFDKEVKPYSLFSFKHPVNLILLSRFFKTWNSKIAKYVNCSSIFERTKNDIEEYYKSVSELERESRQRRWKIRDDVMIVGVSVGLSTLIQYLISIV